MTKRKFNFINTILFYLFIFFIFSYQEEKMFFYDQEIVLHYFNYIFAPILLCVIGLAYTIIYRRNYSLIPVSSSIKSFIIVITIMSFIYSLFHPMRTNVTYIYILILYLVYNYSTIFPHLISSKTYSIGVIILFASLVYVYISGYSLQIANQINNQTNASYTILYILPLLLCIKNKAINIISLIVTLFVVFTSLKRGGIIAFAFGLISYLYTKYISLSKSYSKNKLINIIIFLLALGMMFILIKYINNYTDGVMLERFNSISDDEGSGRIDIWKRVITLISQSSFIGLLLGHGWDAVYSNMGISSHNDFLEILYDFGLFGIMLYMHMIYKIAKYLKYLIRTKSEYAPILACSLSIFIINSMVSHIVIYPHYFILFLICWGYIFSCKSLNYQ